MNNQIELEIVKILQEVEPLIVSHGGAIEFVKYEDNIVYVRLLGACISCPFSMYTMKLGLEERLRAIFPEVQIINVAS